MTEPAYIDHDGVIFESHGAVQFAIESEEVWIPKSQITDYDDTIMIIPMWLAEKKGLVEKRFKV